jgi:hypothetical protein
MSILHDEIDQLRVQLAGCGAAALGATNPEHVAKRGDWGWSPAYEDVLRLRRRFDKLHEAVKQAMDVAILPLPVLRALEEVHEDMLAQSRGE